MQGATQTGTGAHMGWLCMNTSRLTRWVQFANRETVLENSPSVTCAFQTIPFTVETTSGLPPRAEKHQGEGI